MTTYTADTVLEDQTAAGLLEEIREAGEKRLAEIKFPPLAMETPGFEPGGPRGEFERIMYCLREVAAENAPCSRQGLYNFLRDTAIQQVVDQVVKYKLRSRQGRSVVLASKRLEVSEAILAAFVEITL